MWITIYSQNTNTHTMRRNLLAAALLALGFPSSAQILVHIEPNTLFYVGESALVYNGGGLQTKGNGIFDIRGDVMVEGGSTDELRTLDNNGTGNKYDGGNIILRLNNPANHSDSVNPSTYGQLYISGLMQNNISAIVDKEYRATKHGTYQQLALPFYDKPISSLSGTGIGTFGKMFSNVRYSQNEVLVYNNVTAVSDNLNVMSVTPRSTAYYMLGSKNMDFSLPPAGMQTNSPTPIGSVYTLKGVPFADGITEILTNAANGVNFGPTGNALNYYNERYNSYHQDYWDYSVNPSNPWSTPNFGRNIYQFANPYFINLDLGLIGVVENGTITDNNAISSIQGISYDPGNVVTNSAGTFAVNPKLINFTESATPQPVGDLGLIIKPMQAFIIKLRDNELEVAGNKTLSFDNLRRFKSFPRTAGSNYNPNAKQNAGSVKQLGVIGLDENGVEIARTYYAVYPSATSGHTSNGTVQYVLGQQSILGTFEEDANAGGYDLNYKNSYWLYINEANETDFLGKAIPLALYSNSIKSLKFEIRENAKLINHGVHDLSTGIGFYYKFGNDVAKEITQNQVISVTGDQYELFYGKPTGALATETIIKPSRTMITYDPLSDNFLVRFDSNWKNADIKIYDMSGKLILSTDNVLANKDFVIDLEKSNSAYIVTAVSEKGEKVSSKIIR